MFHIEKDLDHNIKDAKMEDQIQITKRMIKYMLFQNEHDMRKLRKNSDSMRKITEGKNEKEIVEIVLNKLNSLYADNQINSGFLRFKTREGLLRISYWYHQYLSSRLRQCLITVTFMNNSKFSRERL